ncbi:MAG: hypothetical protein H7A40_05480 [Chlamydiales bacterium]|nr:hypothetical protein [Chlamydiales bacterium]
MKNFWAVGLILLCGCMGNNKTCCFAPAVKSKTSGEYAFINAKDSIEAFNGLTEKGIRPDYRIFLAEKILKDPSTYNPIGLLAVGIHCLKNDDYYWGTLLTRVAHLRAKIDIAMSQDPSLQSIPDEMLEQVRLSVPKLDEEKFKQAWDQVKQDALSWDKGSPRNYDRRWASLRSEGRHTNAPLNYVGFSEEARIVEEIHASMKEG